MTQEFLTKVPHVWRETFERFVSTGEAPDEFLAFLDRDAATQEAVEAAFAAQVKELSIGADAIAAHLDRKQSGEQDRVPDATSNLSAGLLAFASLDPVQQDELAQRVAAFVTPSGAAKAIDALDLIKEKLAALATRS